MTTSEMKLIAEKQIVGIGNGFGFVRNLYEMPNGIRISEPLTTSIDFNRKKNKNKTAGQLIVCYPGETPLFPVDYCTNCGGQIWFTTVSHHEKGDCKK